MVSAIRTAIVTGGTGALGSVIVGRFLDAGDSVVVPYHSEKPVSSRATPREGAKLRSLRADLASEADVSNLIEFALRESGRIDILVNAAGGYSGGKKVEESLIADFDRMMKMNFLTTLLTCRAVLPVMRRQGFGRIVNIAAMPALAAKPQMGPYAVAKRAVVTLTETIAEEVKGTGITSNAIALGIILTQANKQSMPDADVSKWVPPEEIAELIVHLCSGWAGGINGNVIRVSGGL